ncbi:MAG TPA: ABC transporter ATP-binding protein [Vicinamibacterales bacterium]|nr:ABC transporter ATP-binding protein [Vicinamibacterales bacterium]
MADAAIRIEGLTKYYGPVVGIEDLTLDIAPGEVFGFLGANGAGKTTTIRLLLDLLRPTRGRASVLGVDCHRDSLNARLKIGYLPGELPIYRDLSAAGYLDYLARLDTRPVAPDYLRYLLRRFDVSDIDAKRALRVQSHGMKQKIGIIQALMTRAPVVILDEPTAGLDPLMAQAFRDTIAELRRRGDTTVFLSSHVLTEVEATCGRIGLIRGGRIVTLGTIEDLKRAATRRVIVTFADGTAPLVTDVRGPLGPLLTSLNGRAIHDVTVEPFKLEDYIARFYAETAAK